jgi:chromosome partitioning protein
MKVIAIAHLKGGTGKTTTTGFLAHALVNMGYMVLVIDADPQGSLFRWSRRAHWSIPVRHLPSRHIDRDLAGILTDDFDFVVIDTAGPNSDAEIVASAMRAADVIVLPTAPNPADLERVKFTYDVAAEEGATSRVRILLTQADAAGPDSRDAREAQLAAGRLVLDAEIRPRKAVARTTSLLPVKPALGYSGYTGVALELLK